MNILGPCSAESREQVIETARELMACKFPFIYRAGVWKPRTSPHSFQGAGAEGLAWLQEVKERFGIPVATEVASPEHVRLALEAGIDYLWIGARSSATPIVVQAIADAIGFAISELGISGLKGIIIMNPVNADGDLWLGNIERLEKTGIPVIAVHRGCNHQPCWFMAHQVRLARPDIPMLLDPSHMSGDAAKVPELMKKVAELGLDGAMVEVHYNPAKALSDAKQQIKPADIEDWKLEIGDGKDTELNWLRAEIDELDEQLWDTIAKRMDVSRRIGAWKKAHNMTPLQPERYREIVERIKSRDESQESRDFMLKIWEIIHEQSLREQE